MITAWGEDSLLMLLIPNGWYSTAHQQGSFLWSLPPAAALVAINESGKAQHKSPDCFHVVVVPRLMTGLW